jgi:K+-sensing histidine kinase KdpD
MKPLMNDFRLDEPNNCTIMAGNSPKLSMESLTVAWPDTVRFVRQLSHDLRNDLNAIELQSAYIGELTQDQELTSEIKRLREVVSGLNATLQRLSRAVGEIEPNLISYPAGEFLADMRTQIERNFSKENHEITWDVQLEDCTLNIDPQLFQEVFVELFTNAFRHDRGEGSITAAAGLDKGRFFFTLSEPKPTFARSTENWGREPLRTLGQGHYGLGLYRTRATVEAHKGKFSARHDSSASSLVTTVSLPLATPESQ